jgi:hypothetical protein
MLYTCGNVGGVVGDSAAIEESRDWATARAVFVFRLFGGGPESLACFSEDSCKRDCRMRRPRLLMPSLFACCTQVLSTRGLIQASKLFWSSGSFFSSLEVCQLKMEFEKASLLRRWTNARGGSQQDSVTELRRQHAIFSACFHLLPQCRYNFVGVRGRRAQYHPTEIHIFVVVGPLASWVSHLEVIEPE